MRRDSSKFRERFLRWKNGELVYEGGRAVPQYLDGKDDDAYQLFLSTLPDNLRQPDSGYKMRRGWELYGKPKDLALAAIRGWLSPENDGWHASSVGYNSDTDTYEVLKRDDHLSRWMEDVYGYWNNPQFRMDYKIEKGSGGFDKYVPTHSKLSSIPQYEDGKDSSPWSPQNVNAWRNGWAPAQYTGSPSQRKLLYNQSGDYYYGGKLADVTVTGRKPYRWVSANTPQLTVGDAVKGVHTAINPVLAWTSPSQYVGAIRDAMDGGNFFTSMMRGNSGIATPQFEQEHPWISLGLNFAGDVAGIGGVSKAIRPVANKIGGAVETLRYGPLGKPRSMTNPNRLDFVYHGRGTYRGEPEQVLRNYSHKDVGLHVSPRRATAEEFLDRSEENGSGFLYEGIDVNNNIPNIMPRDMGLWEADTWGHYLDRIDPKFSGPLNQIIDYFGLDRQAIRNFASKHDIFPKIQNREFADYLRQHGVKFNYENLFEGGGIQLPSRFLSDPSDIWWYKKIQVEPLDVKTPGIAISYNNPAVPNGTIIPMDNIITKYILLRPNLNAPSIPDNYLPVYYE